MKRTTAMFLIAMSAMAAGCTPETSTTTVILNEPPLETTTTVILNEPPTSIPFGG